MFSGSEKYLNFPFRGKETWKNSPFQKPNKINLVVGTKHKNAKFDAFRDLFKSPIMFEIIGSHCTESTNRMSAMWQRLRATNQDEIRSKSILDSNSLASSAEDMVRLGTWSGT